MKTTKSLFDIAEDIRLLEDMVPTVEDDQEQMESIVEFLEEAHGEMSAKIDNYCELISEIKARIEVRKQRIKEMQALVKTDENTVKRLVEVLKWYFESHEIKRMDTERHRVTIAKNGGKTPVSVQEDYPINLVPDEYVTVVRKLNLDAIREALEAKSELPFATLGERQTSLRIK